MSPDAPNTVTIIANYIPLEQPAGGPNFPAFDDTVLYEIHIDNDGDAKDNVTYQFKFRTDTRNPNTFLYNTGVIDTLDDTDWNRPQFYRVEVDRKGMPGFKLHETLGSDLPTPPDNIGPRSTPGYAALAAAAVQTLPGGIKVFAGQRDDAFYVDLGSIFDLAGLRPFNPAHILPLAADAGHDGVAYFNTHSIAMQIPVSQIVRPGKPTIGIYASASRQQVRVLKKDGEVENHGQYVQVSRLGNPLINEVVIPIGRKDEWNREDPSEDSQFESYYLSPEVTRLANFLYPPLNDAAENSRTDIVTILLTGFGPLNFTGNKRADLLRLNTALSPGALGSCFGGAPTAGAPSRLAVLDGDLCGFPNGRRLADDVVDIEVRALMQGYGAFLNTNFGLPSLAINNTLSDGVDTNADMPFLSTFPYIGLPHQGYQVP